jgi:hypothetical protein
MWLIRRIGIQREQIFHATLKRSRQAQCDGGVRRVIARFDRINGRAADANLTGQLGRRNSTLFPNALETILDSHCIALSRLAKHSQSSTPLDDQPNRRKARNFFAAEKHKAPVNCRLSCTE